MINESTSISNQRSALGTASEAAALLGVAAVAVALFLGKRSAALVGIIILILAFAGLFFSRSAEDEN